MTLTVQLTASVAIDQLRVVTASSTPVPSLSPLGLLLVGGSILVSTCVVTRKRQRA